MTTLKLKSTPVMVTMTVEEFDKWLDDAVSEGRCNWDGYYGHDNTFHMKQLRDSVAYKELMKSHGK